MKPNIGRMDAYCRITLGLAMLACSTAKFVHRPMGTAPLIGALIGGMKVAEGVTRFCPLVCLAEQQLDQYEWNNGGEKHKETTVNPS